MSVIGTGAAAAVAQTAHQAQQVARRRDKSSTEAASEARRVRDLLETHFQAVEEGDETDTPTQLHIDGQLPEHQSVPPQELSKQGDADPEAPIEPVDGPLYRHLDIQA